MMIYPRCPLCDELCPEGVAQHAWDVHCEGHVRLMFPFAFCWCGARVTTAPSWDGIDVHLAEHGGLQAHWLEHHLGLTNPFGDVPYTSRPVPW